MSNKTRSNQPDVQPVVWSVSLQTTQSRLILLQLFRLWILSCVTVRGTPLVLRVLPNVYTTRFRKPEAIQTHRSQITYWINFTDSKLLYTFSQYLINLLPFPVLSCIRIQYM